MKKRWPWSSDISKSAGLPIGAVFNRESDVTKEFALGVVVVTIGTADGAEHIEDWNPKDAAKAKEYASETSHCSDVAWTRFEDTRTGENTRFAKAI